MIIKVKSVPSSWLKRAAPLFEGPSAPQGDKRAASVSLASLCVPLSGRSVRGLLSLLRCVCVMRRLSRLATGARTGEELGNRLWRGWAAAGLEATGPNESEQEGLDNCPAPFVDLSLH